MGWWLGALIVALLTALSLLAYLGAGALAKARLGLHLQRQVVLRALQLGQPLLEGERSVRRLHQEWQLRASQQVPADLRERFARLFARGDDGVWRLRPEQVDAQWRPTFYLQHGQSGPDDDMRWRALLSHQLLSERGPALVPPHFSAYVDFVERGLMVYSRGIDWGRGATPQTNNFDYPTMQGSDPARNPQRRLFWTPVYYDGEAKAWMVSVIQPLDWQGRWVGTVGHDLALDTLLRSVSERVEPGFTVMVFNPEGALIAHPALAERIAKAQGQLERAQSGDPQVQEAWTLMRLHLGKEEGLALSEDGERLVAWARMPGPGWWAVEVADVALINRTALRQFSPYIALCGLVALALGLWLQRRLVRSRVQKPLEGLGEAIATLRSGRLPLPIGPIGSVGWQGEGELARIGTAFDQMTLELGQRRAQDAAHAEALQREVQTRQQAEADLRALNESLERRIEERTLALRELNEGLQRSLLQLQAAQQELVQKETLAGLGALVAGVAHELNTPLGNALLAGTTAQEISRALQQELTSGRARRSEVLQLGEKLQSALELIGGALQRSVELVRGFKQVAVDRASLQRRRFLLHEVTQEVVGLFALAHKRQAYRFEVDLPDDVALDSHPGAYGQVLTNLLQNAVVHGFEGRSEGLVRIHLLRRSAARIELEVADDGRGIAPEHLGSVFKPFFTTRMGQGGSGLGLHIVYSLVTGALGGRIEVTSEVGKGCRFRLDLPLVAPEELSAGDAEPAPAPSADSPAR
ncbi:MAG: sensor histidine kinase [Burkholderiales bacterium]|nr:sensor histidine kinase [Burkholderiales bacterium]